jgi:hypothetical protein
MHKSYNILGESLNYGSYWVQHDHYLYILFEHKFVRHFMLFVWWGHKSKLVILILTVALPLFTYSKLTDFVLWLHCVVWVLFHSEKEHYKVAVFDGIVTFSEASSYVLLKMKQMLRALTRGTSSYKGLISNSDEKYRAIISFFNFTESKNVICGLKLSLFLLFSW